MRKISLRKIKFRAKDIAGKWFYGTFTRFGKSNIPCINYFDPNEGKQSDTPIEPETLGQFTGFYDCHKKEIYEGDVLECQDSFSGNIGYVKIHCGCWSVFYHKRAQGSLYWFTKNQKIRIIGNIYDHPELTKGDD